MTEEQKTELSYLLDIVFEASKWKIEDGQDAIRLEIENRIKTLILTDKETVVTCEPEISPVLTGDDFNALEAARLNEHLASPEKVEKAWEKKFKWKLDKVRCFEDGKIVWHPRNECVQEPRDNSKGGPKWHWVWHDPNKVKQEQEDAMWEEHENGEE
jgi:hypothetical protein